MVPTAAVAVRYTTALYKLQSVIYMNGADLPVGVEKKDVPAGTEHLNSKEGDEKTKTS